MVDALVLERLEAALVPPPEMASAGHELNVPDSLLSKANLIIKKSREWSSNLKKAVLKARNHPDHPTRSPEMWAHLEPIFSEAIALRVKFIGDIDGLIEKADNFSHPVVDETVAMLRRVASQVSKEHNVIVDLYYMLKSDADEHDPETHGDGPSFSSGKDLRDHLSRLFAA